MLFAWYHVHDLIVINLQDEAVDMINVHSMQSLLGNDAAALFAQAKQVQAHWCSITPYAHAGKFVLLTREWHDQYGKYLHVTYILEQHGTVMPMIIRHRVHARIA